LLDKILESVNIKREDIYITNILKCRPPNNRDPKEEEIKACTPYLNRQLEIIQPKVIVTLGNYATKFILKKFGYKEESVSKVHGKVFRVRNLIFNLKIIPSYHPAAALYNPNLRNMLFEDFKIIKKELEMEK
jgi:uracil-DNA glycosylase family 4